MSGQPDLPRRPGWGDWSDYGFEGLWVCAQTHGRYAVRGSSYSEDPERWTWLIAYSTDVWDHIDGIRYESAEEAMDAADRIAGNSPGPGP
jgi:hypothetical protein